MNLDLGTGGVSGELHAMAAVFPELRYLLTFE
jgi:hypothetical protein